MAQITADHRTQFLLAWAETQRAKGFTMPDAALLEQFGKSNSLDGLSRDSRVIPWLPALEFFQRQWKMGVSSPSLPNALSTPVGSVKPPADAEPMFAPPATVTPAAAAAGLSAVAAPATADPAPVSTTDSYMDRRLAALKVWRDGEVANGTENASALKDSLLKTIAQLAVSTANGISAPLPASLSSFAPAIAGVLAGVAESRAAAEAHPGADAGSALAPQVEPELSVPSEASATPAHAAVQPEQAATADADVPAFFAPYAFGEQTSDVTSLLGTLGADSGLALSWDAVGGAPLAAFYRVVSSDEYMPYNPDLADVIGVTTATAIHDLRPSTSAVRAAQVWAHFGPTPQLAASSQPVLHAQGLFVAQPKDVDIREDEGRVIGQWSIWPGIARVQVFRIPQERAVTGRGDPQYRILPNRDNLGGFVDAEAKRGSRYLYEVRAEAPVDGRVQLSMPVSVPLLISEVIEPVMDLAIEAHGADDDRQFDLSWTAPSGGQVVIYRTALPPLPGANLRPIAEAALEQALLGAENRLAHPVDVSVDGSSHMTNVPWPREWTRAYFTPVTLLAGQAFVGKTISHAGPRSISMARIVERVNQQVLTFAWPDGAASVQAYASPIGAGAELAMKNSQPIEISAEQYKERGGLRFPSNLPPKGCEIHLVPVAFQAGDRVEGTPVTIVYPGLTRMRYELKSQRNLLGQVTGVTFSVIAIGKIIDKPYSFVLVHNPDRFPLGVSDGTALSVIPDDMDGIAPVKRLQLPQISNEPGGRGWKTSPDTWKSEVGRPSGYVRLLVDLPPDTLVTVALLDPAPSALRLQSLAERIGMAGG